MRFTRRLNSRRLIRGVVGFVILIGPWPAWDMSSTDDSSVRDTPSPTELSLGRLATGPLRVGTAEADLSILGPIPLAGFVDRIAHPYQSVGSPCGVQALTLLGAGADVTVLTADLLLIDRELARAVLDRTGLASRQVYFTATHTHSGPGAWGNHPLERLVAGSFDPEVFEQLAERIADTIQRSRAQPVPAEVAFVQVDCPGLQRNRVRPGAPTDDRLSAWSFRALGPQAPGPVLATLAVFGAHATIGHETPPRLGGDYPAAFRAALREQVRSGLVLFAAGSVGDSSPVRPPAPTPRRQIEAFGRSLADRLATALAGARYGRSVSLGNRRLEVNLPPVQVPFGMASLRFSPLATWWIGDRRSAVHLLRIGPATLVGFPGDCAGHLATRLRADRPVVATSFNGDYRGYLVSRATFHQVSCYETRGMSFHGANLGEVVIASAQRILDEWTAGSADPGAAVAPLPNWY